MLARFVLLGALAVGIVDWRGDGRGGVHAKEGSVRADDNVNAAAAADNNNNKASGHDMTAVLRSLAKHKPGAPIGVGGDRELSAPIVLTFEGVGDLVPVGNYYNGGAGPNYGVVFGSSGVAAIGHQYGGNGYFENEPSPNTTFTLLDAIDTTVTVAAGFTALSFSYATSTDFDLVVYDEPNGTGNAITSFTVPNTGLCGYPVCMYRWGIWDTVSVPFSGVAKSIKFTRNSYNFFMDDMTITLAPVTCSKTTYWLWDPKTDTVVRELVNNSASCIAVPYNIEVRPCAAPKSLPVTITLQNATSKAGIKTQAEYYAPYYLWGDTTATGDVYPNKKPLPKGMYYLNTNIDGKVEKITFTKTC